MEKEKLEISEVLKHIDAGDESYYDSLSDDLKKQFTPYTVLRFLGSIDDSVQLEFQSKALEAVVGKWSSGGKKVLEELIAEFEGTCFGVRKYENAKYDWRISFSLKSTSDYDSMAKLISEFGVSPLKSTDNVDPTLHKLYLVMLNRLVNEEFWEINKNTELMYKVMCSVSKTIPIGALKRKWLPFSKSISNANEDVLNIIKRTLPELYSNINDTEYDLVLNQYDEKEFSELLDDMGIEPTEKKSILKSFKSEIKKHGKETDD